MYIGDHWMYAIGDRGLGLWVNDMVTRVLVANISVEGLKGGISWGLGGFMIGFSIFGWFTEFNFNTNNAASSSWLDCLATRRLDVLRSPTELSPPPALQRVQ